MFRRIQNVINGTDKVQYPAKKSEQKNSIYWSDFQLEKRVYENKQRHSSLNKARKDLYGLNNNKARNKARKDLYGLISSKEDVCNW